MATQMPTQTPTRVGARGARRSTAQMILESLPQTSTAALSNDLLANFRQAPLPNPAQLQMMQQAQVRRPAPQGNPAAVLGTNLRSLTRMGPQGMAELQSLLVNGPQRDLMRRAENDSTQGDSQGNRAPTNMQNPGKGPTPGWARTLGMMGLGALTSQLGVPGAIIGMVARNWNNDAAGTAADIGTQAFNASLPAPVRALLSALRVSKVADPVKDMVTNPLAAAIRENITNTATQPPAPPAPPAEGMVPSPGEESIMSEEEAYRAWRDAQLAGRTGGGARPPGAAPSNPGAVTSPVDSGSAVGNPLGPVDGNYGGAGWGGFGSGQDGGSSGGGGMHNTGQGGPGSMGGW